MRPLNPSSGQEAAQHPGCLLVDLHALGQQIGGGLVASLLGTIGLKSMCVGGGQGMAMIVERLS